MEPLERISRTEKVLESLKERITSGSFEVGDKFDTEADICKSLNVGRSTVREALRILQTMGYIEIKPGRGAFVARTKEADMFSVFKWFVKYGNELKDLMDVRMGIEPLAVKLAIERASDKQIENIEKIHQEFLSEMNTMDPVRLSILDEAFHKAIFLATNNKLLISLNDKLCEILSDYRNKAFSVKENVTNAVQPHKDILDGIKSKNKEEAQKAMVKHIEVSLEDIKVVIRKSEEKSNEVEYGK